MTANSKSALAFFTFVPMVYITHFPIRQLVFCLLLGFTNRTDSIVIMAIAIHPQIELMILGSRNFRFPNSLAFGTGLFLETRIFTGRFLKNLVTAPLMFLLITFAANTAYGTMICVIFIFPAAVAVVTAVLATLHHLVGSGIIEITALAAFIILFVGMGGI